MRALRISSIVTLVISLILQILPLGIVISTANIVMYYSYFSIVAWDNGVIGPFFCALFTIALIGLSIGTFFFKKVNEGYLLAINILSWLAVIVSFLPALFNAYTTVGGIISGLLLTSTELNMMIHSKLCKK